MPMKLTFEKLINSKKAYNKISSYITKTPLDKSFYLSKKLNSNIFFKLENIQKTGSFKVRGAFNKILSLDREVRKKGVVTISTGNHGLAVSYAGSILNVPVKVCVPEWIPETKLEAIKMYGATSVLYGRTFEERKAKADEIQKKEKLTFIHSFDEPKIIE